MTRSVTLSARSSASADQPLYPADLEPAIQQTLSILADIETQYEDERDQLERWSGPETVKERLAGQLESRRQQDREPYVQRLAELHQRMMSLTMFRDLRTLH
jgi:hypothetical protein